MFMKTLTEQEKKTVDDLTAKLGIKEPIPQNIQQVDSCLTSLGYQSDVETAKQLIANSEPVRTEIFCNIARQNGVEGDSLEQICITITTADDKYITLKTLHRLLNLPSFTVKMPPNNEPPRDKQAAKRLAQSRNRIPAHTDGWKSG